MAIRDLISPGIGFSPGSGKYIVTRGLLAGAAVVASGPDYADAWWSDVNKPAHFAMEQKPGHYTFSDKPAHWTFED